MNDTGNEGEIIERAVARIAPAHDFGELLMNMLRDPAIPADKMEVVINARQRGIADEARENYQFHFAAFAAEMPPVERDGMVELVKDGVSKGRIPFTTYEQMDSVLRPLLTKHGFALQFWSSAPETKDVIVVHGALTGWGWSRESTYPVPPDTGPGRNALQARGSSQTYAKRYIADLLCNIVRKGKDNDGKLVGEAFIDERQIGELAALIKATATVEANFLRTMVTGAEALADIRAKDFPRLVLALKGKQSKAKK
jgi:hypothetical protein